MAATLWGRVYYDDRYAGELRQEPGGRGVFTYDRSYLSSKIRPSPSRCRSRPLLTSVSRACILPRLVAG